MGNNPSTPEVIVSDKEMDKCQRYTNQSDDQNDPLLGAEQLLEMCQKLEDNVDSMAKAIADVVFEDGNGHLTDDEQSETEILGPNSEDCCGESVSRRGGVEQRIHKRARCIRNLIRALRGQLDRHARLVGSIDNVRLMGLVTSVVGSVNTYVTMLMRYIRKLRRLLAEKGDGKTRRGREFIVHDIIQNSQDVDAMLVELSRSEKGREELVKDAITVLVIYRDYKRLGDIGQEDIDEDVRTAAESIAHGLNMSLGSHSNKRQ